MLKLVYKTLNVRREEEGQVALMLGHGFFMGVFFATFSATSETVFINTLGGEFINQGIFVAGIFGVFTTAIFAFLQGKISFGKLTIINLVAIFLVTCTLFYLLKTMPKGTQEYDYVVFGVFAMNGPLVAVFLLGFWGIFGRMFDLRQAKRIIGGIDTGQLSAAILAFFVMGLLDITNVENYLLVSATGILISLFFLLAIIRKYDMDVVKIHESKQSSTSISALFKNEYVLLLSIFLALSVAAFVFVERTYLTVLNGQFEDQPQQLLRFIAWFSATILILSFLFQTFINDWIIAKYGLKIALGILPVVLAVFVGLTIGVGTVFGFTPGDSDFFWFFLFVALSKLFVSFLRDAMENPAFKLYFMPLDPTIRFDIQTKVEGVVNEFTKVLAGGLILALGYFALFNSLNYYYILVIIIFSWIFVIGKLHNEYRNRIKIKLENQKSSLETDQSITSSIQNDFEKDLETTHPKKAIYSFKLMEKLNPNLVSNGINSMMRNQDEEIRDYAQRKMNEIRGVSVSDRYVISVKTQEDAKGKQVIQGDDLFSLLETGDISKRRIAKLSRSEKVEDRQYGAELIGNSSNEDTLSYLIELLRDIEPNVRLAAINAAEKKQNREILNGLIFNLGDARYENIALNTLVVIGKNSLEALDSGFYRIGQSFQVMRKIIQIMGRIGGTRAKQLLWNKIDYPDKVLASQVLKSLGECGFKADFNQITRIKYAIESDIEDISWNLAAYNEVPNTADGQVLKMAIKEENDHDIEHIYVLLSMLYDPKSIKLVKDNINSGTSEGATFAIELLDVFLSEDLKQKIIPVLDDLSNDEKIKKLEIFYPRAPLSSTEVIKLLINRDFNQTNRWSKTCALHMIGTMRIKEYSYDLIANLFNPDRMVKEIAAWSLYQIDKQLYHENIERLDDRTSRYLNASISKAELRSLQYDKVLNLKSLEMFNDVPGLILSDMVNVMEEIGLEEGNSYSLTGENKGKFYVVYKGILKNYSKGKVAHIFEEGDFIGELFEDDVTFNSNILVSEENAIIWSISKEQFYGLLSDNIDIARKVVSYLRVA